MKRSPHLGPTDIYLEDLSNLDAEQVALYFPKRYEFDRAVIGHLCLPSLSIRGSTLHWGDCHRFPHSTQPFLFEGLLVSVGRQWRKITSTLTGYNPIFC